MCRSACACASRGSAMRTRRRSRRCAPRGEKSSVAAARGERERGERASARGPNAKRARAVIRATHTRPAPSVAVRARSVGIARASPWVGRQGLPRRSASANAVGAASKSLWRVGAPRARARDKLSAHACSHQSSPSSFPSRAAVPCHSRRGRVVGAAYLLVRGAAARRDRTSENEGRQGRAPRTATDTRTGGSILSFAVARAERTDRRLSPRPCGCVCSSASASLMGLPPCSTAYTASQMGISTPSAGHLVHRDEVATPSATAPSARSRRASRRPRRGGRP